MSPDREVTSGVEEPDESVPHGYRAVDVSGIIQDQHWIVRLAILISYVTLVFRPPSTPSSRPSSRCPEYRPPACS